MPNIFWTFLQHAGFTIVDIVMLIGIFYWCLMLHKNNNKLAQQINELLIDKNITKVHLANICKKLDYLIRRIDKQSEIDNKFLGGYN